jgi:hypothetical protein
MVHHWAASALLLVLCALPPSVAFGQSKTSGPPPVQRQSDAARKHGTLGQNQPNPFPRETTIPFTVGDDSCASGTEQHVVTLRIYNILSQLVSVPVLTDSANADGTAVLTSPRPVNGLQLSCGAYSARWDGKHSRSGRRAAPGVYMYQLVVDGRPAGMKKMLVSQETPAP